jgi:hypothetical protein
MGNRVAHSPHSPRPFSTKLSLEMMELLDEVFGEAQIQLLFTGIFKGAIKG